MILSCSTHCLPDFPLEEALRVIHEAGYESVEISAEQLDAAFGDMAKETKAIRKLLWKYHLHAVGVRLNDLAAVDFHELHKHLETIQRQMEGALELGSLYVSVRGGDRRRQSLPMLSAGVDHVLDQAKQLDMSFTLANGYKTRVEQLEDIRYIMSEVHDPGLCLLNDTGQFHSAAVNPRYAIREYGLRNWVVHITDQVGRQTVPIGEGEMNVRAIIEHLRRIGYNNWLVVDQSFEEWLKGSRYLAEARRTLSDLWTAT
jgi:sugar phosphate isomerase/epimerase